MKTYASRIDALGDPTRRRVLELLRSGPASVGALAGRLPVSRPAVSQHLRALRDAGLVTYRREGTRHVYAVDLAGLADMRAWLDTFWDDALDRYNVAAEQEMSETTVIEPVVKSLTVHCPVERAFTVFTREIGTWWPTDTHAQRAGEVQEVVWEEHQGGEVYEIATGGERGRWATVLWWEPPHRLMIAWQVNPERLGTEVEVRFTEAPEGTRVDLEHRGFEHVADGATLRGEYDSSWDVVLGRLTGALVSG